MYRYHKPVKLKVFTRVEQFISNEIGYLTPNLEWNTFLTEKEADREFHPSLSLLPSDEVGKLSAVRFVRLHPLSLFCCYVYPQPDTMGG